MSEASRPRVRLYSSQFCSFCFAARRLLEEVGADYEEIALDDDPELHRRIAEAAGGWSTVPMIFIGDEFVGGFAELLALHRSGRLAEILEGAA